MRKFLIGGIAALVGTMAFSSAASADTTAVSIDATNVTPAKQDKKVRGGVSVFFQSADTHEGVLQGEPGCLTANPGCKNFPASTNSFITFPTDFKFDPGTLPDCNLSSLTGKDTAGAKAACPKSIVGTGTNLQAFLDGRLVNGAITAFNGAPSGGKPSMYLLVDLPGVTSKPILNGVISGNTMNVILPPVPGSAIERFDITINGKLVTKKKKNKKTGKVKKTFYFSAKCSKKSWTTTETVTYQTGKTLTDSTTQKCTQKKKKK